MSYQGLILRVDLGTGNVSREDVPPEIRRKYLGGEGINSRLLWEHFLQVDPLIDPLSSDNVLILGAGPLAGTCVGGGSKMKFTYKSPAYNIYGDTSSGGGLVSQIRWAGYDHIVITGKSGHPVYLWIKDDEVEIRDARHLWGKTVPEADEAIKQELGDSEVESACIGPAGENLVRFASIMVSSHRAGGRGGGGCVMGSKNLKAIAARGTKGIDVHDADALFRAMDDFRMARSRGLTAHMRYGTLRLTRSFHGLGFNTYRNAQGYEMPDEAVNKLDHNWYTRNLGVRARACSTGCAFACSHWHYIRGDESAAARNYAGEWGTRPEFGAANPLGHSCDVQDMPAVAHLTKMCNEYGMDTMEIGMGMSFLMELRERGIVTEEDIRAWTGGEPLSLEWGNYQAMERVIEATALQQNTLGEILGGGVYRAAVRIGGLKGVDVLKYANYGKAGATHEGPARAWPQLGIACAVASIGAHHLKGIGLGPGASQMYLGKPEAGDMFSTALKGAGHAISENLSAMANSLGLCIFLFGRDPDKASPEWAAQALAAVTGIEMTGEELITVGERIVNIQKAFNSRLGLRREDDTVCERWLNEPQIEGHSRGMKVGNYLESAKDEYYQWHGWDQKTSLQTREKLEELDMTDVARVLEKEDAVV